MEKGTIHKHSRKRTGGTGKATAGGVQENDEVKDPIDVVLQTPKLRKIGLQYFPKFWMSFYFPEYFETPDDYVKIFQHLMEGGNLIRLGYRGCAKTTLIRKYLAMCIANGRKKFIRRTSYEARKANDNVTSLSNMIIGNNRSRFVSDYGTLYHSDLQEKTFKQKEEKRMSGFTTKNGTIVRSNSLGGSTRGLNYFLGDRTIRPDCDVLDDIDDDKNTVNPDIIKKNFDIVTGAIFGGNPSQKIILGNVIHEDGILPRLIEKYKRNIKRMIVRTKLIDKGQIHRPERFVQTDEEASQINSIIDDDTKRVISIDSLREEQGRDWFGANYLLEPMRNDARIIEEQRIQYKTPRFNAWGDGIFISIDNAESEKDGSDPIGIVVGRKIGMQKKWHILHAERLKGRQKDPYKVLEKIEFLYNRFTGNRPFIIEDKAGGISMRKHIIHQLKLQAILYSPGKNTKGMRLREVQPYIESGDITFAPDIDRDFITELTKFPGVEHDDRIDAFTALIIKTMNGMFDEGIKGQTDKKEVEKQSESDKTLESILGKYNNLDTNRGKFTNF